MRVLHINCNYTGTSLHQIMIEKLEALGIDNQVYVSTYDKKLGVITPDPNVVVSQCFRKWDRVFFDYKQKKIIKDIQHNIAVSEFNLIHAYTLFSDGNAAMHLHKKYSIPYVVAIRNTDVNAFFRLLPYLRPRGVEIMRNASAVFFLSESYRANVFEKYIPAKYQDEIAAKTFVIPNGIDDFWHQNIYTVKTLNSIDKKVRLIYAGKIDKNKNISQIQNAMSLLQEKGYEVSLTVVGKTVDEKVYDRIKMNAHTQCFPPKPKEELIRFYRQSDIFIMPSYKETFGLVYAEAMSQGLPVIYTSGQGFDGQFAEGKVGYHVNPDNPSDIADKIVEIVKNYSVISNNCLTLVNKFNWNEIVLKYRNLYMKC